MTNIVKPWSYQIHSIDVDLDKLPSIVWSGSTGDFFPDEREPNGIFAVLYSDPYDEKLYNAIREMVDTWDAVEDDEVGGVIYKRPDPVTDAGEKVGRDD